MVFSKKTTTPIPAYMKSEKQRTSHNLPALLAAVILSFIITILFPKSNAEQQDLPPPDIGGITVATWNMEWFPSGNPEPQTPSFEKRQIRTAGAILRSKRVPDILIAEEIRDRETCDKLVKQIRDPDFKCDVCSDFMYTPTNRGLQQVAIFSRYPTIKKGSVPFRFRNGVFPPRGFAWAIFDVNGAYIAAYALHLKSNYIPEEQDPAIVGPLNVQKREEAIRQILAHAKRQCQRGVNGKKISGVIIAGDFNTSLEDSRFAGEKTCRLLLDAGFADAFEGVPVEQRTTLPANDFYPPAIFDRLYALGFDAPLGRLILPQTEVSDHCPVYVVWPVPPAGQAIAPKEETEPENTLDIPLPNAA